MSSEVRAVLCGLDPKRKWPKCDHNENSDTMKLHKRQQVKVTVQESEVTILSRQDNPALP